jgi:thiol-disulfide isomerase/thioredoxin
MTIAAAHSGLFDPADAEGASRELTALGRAGEWLNSPRLTAEKLAGKVVLVDFCTYTCINWLRTLPYIRAWAQKYRQGLVVIGVHTPEFAFERNVDNVRRALGEMRVDYPIAIDSHYAIWRAFARVKSFSSCKSLKALVSAASGYATASSFVVGIVSARKWASCRSMAAVIGMPRQSFDAAMSVA